MRLLYWLSAFTFFTLSLSAQQKTMSPEVFNSWNTIKDTRISDDGNWVTYTVGNEAGDPALHIYDHQSGNTVRFDRASKAKISADSKWLAFKVHPAVDSIKAMKRRKVKKKDLPNDSLVIYHLRDRTVRTIANVKSFEVPAEWSGWVVYHKEPETVQPDATQTDSTNSNTKKPRKPKKEDGTRLVFYDLNTANIISYAGVLKYKLAEKQPGAIFTNSGKNEGLDSGVYYFDFEKKTERPLFRQRGSFKQLQFDETGQQAAFIADLDTTDNKVRPLNLYYWKNGRDTARLLIASTPVPDTKQAFISENYTPQFSQDGKTLYYGTAPFPILKDTSLLDEEVVNVEVWHYQDQRLYPQQKVQKSTDEKWTIVNAHNLASGKTVPLSDWTMPYVLLADEGNAQYALAIDDQSARMSSSWEGYPIRKNLFLVDKKNGNRKKIVDDLRGNPRFSAKGNNVLWYSTPDTAWYAYSVRDQKIRKLTDNKTTPFYDELNDRPMLPGSYSVTGWADKDQYVYLNDRYDIWQIDPENPDTKKRLTKGRKTRITYRYIRLDRDQRTIDPDAPMLLHYFDHKDKSSGYVRLAPRTGQITKLIGSDHRYTTRVTKSKKSDQLLFTKESFAEFPDIQYTNLNFKSPKKISTANPQQSEYGWGTAEIVDWTDLNGQTLQGMLIKPPNFDPAKKYPMLVNFYERNSDGIHRHRAPYPHRSTINYSYYANRGYLIFNPDVPYRVGYPGESAYNAVMPGVMSLIEKGFVDRENIGLQGHSWGGYQVAYMVTRTNLFKCAESGAPVVNMFSAYGGIRWGSGLSRMFQYEKTQSRIGGTIWEYPLRYLENSPIFTLDKVETPLLILHNDKDGAVPWYQGIEYFVGLRRLGKPAWLLNYNEEPHWPVKRQNRLDFNLKMSEFFDFYLKGGKQPEWMEKPDWQLRSRG